MTMHVSLKGNAPFGWFIKYILFIMAFMLAFSFRLPHQIRAGAYSIYREASRVVLLAQTRDMSSIESRHFVLRYEDEDSVYADMILESSEQFYEVLAPKYNIDKKSKIPVIVYSSREKLNASFGWPASESAMGVYWAGSIRVLSPSLWAGGEDPAEVKEIFISSGPMAHEITHLAVDYVSGGSCPRWLTEGMAQYEEYELTGFRFGGEEYLREREFYPLESMDSEFDTLPDQALAYWQSLLAVEYIISVYGQDSLFAILEQLNRGYTVDSALENTLGKNFSNFQSSYREWGLLNQ